MGGLRTARMREQARYNKAELPPLLRQLHGNDIVALNSQPGKSDRYAIGRRRKLPAGEPASLANIRSDCGQGELFRARGQTGFDIAVDRAVMPISTRDAFAAAWGKENGIELPVSSPGSCRRPRVSSRAPFVIVRPGPRRVRRGCGR